MKETFGERLKDIRLEKHLTQIQVAKSLDVSFGQISFWENNINEPTLSNLIKLALLFNVSIDYLAGLSED